MTEEKIPPVVVDLRGSFSHIAIAGLIIVPFFLAIVVIAVLAYWWIKRINRREHIPSFKDFDQWADETAIENYIKTWNQLVRGNKASDSTPGGGAAALRWWWWSALRWLWSARGGGAAARGGGAAAPSGQGAEGTELGEFEGSNVQQAEGRGTNG